MISIFLDNVYARIEGASKDTEFAIWNNLSFEIEEFGTENVRHRHLFNRKTKKTYTGLMDYVTTILKELDEEYYIIDNREKHEPNANFKLVDEIDVGNMKIPLSFRPYQKEIVNRATEREVIQCATGGG